MPAYLKHKTRECGSCVLSIATEGEAKSFVCEAREADFWKRTRSTVEEISGARNDADGSFGSHSLTQRGMGAMPYSERA